MYNHLVCWFSFRFKQI